MAGLQPHGGLQRSDRFTAGFPQPVRHAEAEVGFVQARPEGGRRLEGGDRAGQVVLSTEGVPQSAMGLSEVRTFPQRFAEGGNRLGVLLPLLPCQPLLVGLLCRDGGTGSGLGRSFVTAEEHGDQDQGPPPAAHFFSPSALAIPSRISTTWLPGRLVSRSTTPLGQVTSRLDTFSLAPIPKWRRGSFCE